MSGYDLGIPGGVQGQVAALARALVRRGAEVCLIAPGQHASPVDGNEVTLYPAGRSYPIRANGSVAPVAPTPTAARATLRALRAFRPEVVHVHEPLLPGPPLAGVLGGGTVVSTFHRFEADFAYRAEGWLLGRLVARRSSVLTAVSKEAAETARSVLGPEAPGMVVVPNGVDTARFRSAREEVAETAVHGGPYKGGERPVVAFLGRLEPRKGALVLLDAIAPLQDLEVVVAGDGPEAALVGTRAVRDKRVRLVGRVGDDEAARLIAAADVFVAPSVKGESFGVVLLEAMAAGTAVVASDLSGYAGAAGSAARLFRAGDPVALREALAELLGDHELRATLVRRGLARAEECSIERVSESYAEQYEIALASARRGRT